MSIQKIDVNYVLTLHDEYTKNPQQQVLPENQIAMTTMVYHYLIEGQHNNLFQLLNNTRNIEL